MRRFTIALMSLLMTASPLAFVGIGVSSAAAAGCSMAGSSGMTAAMVATSGQQINDTIDATGCDIGVYIGPGVTGVVVDGATISGAAVHGVYAQDTSYVTVQNSTVSNNAKAESFPETKAIQLTGTSFSIVKNNVVENNGGGGIAVTDDGPLTGPNPSDPAQMVTISPGGPVPGATMPGNSNKIIGNTVEDNTNGCGIVVSSYIPGAGVSSNLVMSNTVINNPAGIVIAADTPNTTVANNTAILNTSYGNGLADVVVHSNAPGDSTTNTAVAFNTLGSSDSSHPGIGIIVGAEAPGALLSDTLLLNNQISNEQIGIAVNGINDFVRSFTNTFTNVVQEYGAEPQQQH